MRFPKMGMGRHLPSFTSFCFEDPQSSRGPLAREQPHMGASPWPASLGAAMSCPVTHLLSRPSSRGEGGRAGWRDPAWESCALHLPKPRLVKPLHQTSLLLVIRRTSPGGGGTISRHPETPERPQVTPVINQCVGSRHAGPGEAWSEGPSPAPDAWLGPLYTPSL